MRVAWVLLAISCASDNDGDPHEVIACDPTANYMINMQSVSECERACAARPMNTDVCPVAPGPACMFGVTTFSGTTGCCAGTAAPRIVFRECENE